MLIYKLLSTILFFMIMPFYAAARVLKGKFLYGWNIKLGYFKPPKLGNKVIMFHGVSVGEVIALENLIKKTKETFPEYEIVVTTGTKTGQEIAQKKFGEIASFITYFPFDIIPCVRKFLKKIHPSVVLIAETEIWPIFAYACKKRNISLYTINGRISDSTFKLYKILNKFFAHVFSNYTEILTQSREDMEKFISVGVSPDKVRVMRNLKFDVKKSEEEIPDLKKGDNRVIIAGSTHGEENPVIIDIFARLKNDFSDVKFMIAPRHFHRIPEIKDLAKKKNLVYGLRSKNETFEDKDIIILDTMGELSKMYQICDFAFIGGSFNKTGGHNPLEAVVYSKPAISGPSIHNFRDIYWILGRSSAGKVVKNPHELEDYMRLLLTDNEFYERACNDCSEVFKSQQGALNTVIETLKEVL